MKKGIIDQIPDQWPKKRPGPATASPRAAERVMSSGE